MRQMELARIADHEVKAERQDQRDAEIDGDGDVIRVAEKGSKRPSRAERREIRPGRSRAASGLIAPPRAEQAAAGAPTSTTISSAKAMPCA